MYACNPGAERGKGVSLELVGQLGQVSWQATGSVWDPVLQDKLEEKQGF